jgi:SAM-dependent methyltransferase
MDSSLLVRLIGFPATLIHGDTLVLDRWRWVKKRLPRTKDSPALLDVGCGTGAFTIGAALRGYAAVGLSWDIRNQETATKRATICRVSEISFPVQDVRLLGDRPEHFGNYDVVLCLENIEHINDDLRLMKDMYKCLKPGGMLLLSSPNFFYRSISSGDLGPFLPVETGGHVRRGYSGAMLRELCTEVGFSVEEIGSCGGFLSQKITGLWRALNRFPILSFLIMSPLRVLPPLLDGSIRNITGWPDYCICMIAYKPRFSPQQTLEVGSARE